MAVPHLSLALSRELWSELLQASLPFELGEGQLSLAGATKQALRQLEVSRRVSGLLEDRRTPAPVARLGARALAGWKRRRGDVLGALGDLVAVEGTWRVELDELGTRMRYGPQKVAADAYLRGVAEGRLTLLKEGISLPFRLEQRLGASVALGRIRYSPGQQAVIGNVQDLAVHLGDHAVLRLISRLAENLMGQQLPRVAPVTILRREQVEALVGGLGGAMRLAMGVDDMHLHVSDEELELRVRFGFARLAETPQLSDEGGAGAS
ncbi:MAG: hypothetical protein H6732_02340 [Alphaproteobacteria bacterium]|nr:hypothetical protein [Alphaproteobacteria bacterium]